MTTTKTPSAIGIGGGEEFSKIPMPTTGEISLYFHIPFCRKKCPYCHFYVVRQNRESEKTLLNALRLEWERVQPLVHDKKIVSIYFGGGTPFLVGPSAIEQILRSIPISRGAEITLEANPEDVDTTTIEPFAQIGINRLSLGVQSLHNPTLQMLGRSHTAQKAQQAVDAAARAGIDNITIDLMYDIPGQHLSDWISTLEAARALPIRHLSLYNLTFEPQTVFFRKRALLTPLLPSPDESLTMLDVAVEQLQHRFHRYEISAFAEPGYASRHNTGYWEGRPFLGLGPSAFSFWEGRRYRNICDLKSYAALLETGRSPIDFEEKLSSQASLHERLAIALRLTKGVQMSQFPVDPSLYRRLQSRGWLQIENERAHLSKNGLLFYDSVAEEIIICPENS